MSDEYIRLMNSGLGGFRTEGLTPYLGKASVEDAKAFFRISENPEFYKDKLIYLHGPHGSQKTTMVVTTGRQLIRKGYAVRYVLFNDLLRAMTAFDPSDSDSELVECTRSCDFLIIDEFGDESSCNIYRNSMPVLSTFFKERYEVGRKGIILISVNSPSNMFRENANGSLKNLVITSLGIDSLHGIKTEFEFEDIYYEELKAKVRSDRMKSDLSVLKALEKNG